MHSHIHSLLSLYKISQSASRGQGQAMIRARSDKRCETLSCTTQVTPFSKYKISHKTHKSTLVRSFNAACMFGTKTSCFSPYVSSKILDNSPLFTDFHIVKQWIALHAYV